MRTMNYLVLTLLILLAEMAGAQSVGGHGGGLGRRPMARNPGCVEGRRDRFYQPISETSDKMTAVWLECRNGSYYDLSDYVYSPRPIKCTEGRREMREVRRGIDYENVAHLCRNGKWIALDQL